MCLSHGCKTLQVLTDVLGIKCAPKDTKLLGEFLKCMASATSNDQHDVVYLPKGAAYLLGLQIYAQVLQENIFSNHYGDNPCELGI